MEVSFAGGTFAKVTGYYPRREFGILQGLKFECVSCAGGLWDLGSERGGYGMLDAIRKTLNEEERGWYTILSLLLP